MNLAKIYQKRHQHTINGVVFGDEIHYKIIFSDPKEMKLFEKWYKQNGGLYKFNKDTQIQEGKLPILEGLKEGTYCHCDVTTFYLLHVAGYQFKESTSPYKCEIYIKHTN